MGQQANGEQLAPLMQAILAHNAQTASAPGMTTQTPGLQQFALQAQQPSFTPPLVGGSFQGTGQPVPLAPRLQPHPVVQNIFQPQQSVATQPPSAGGSQISNILAAIAAQHAQAQAAANAPPAGSPSPATPQPDSTGEAATGGGAQ